jgi:hypothetical protein
LTKPREYYQTKHFASELYHPNLEFDHLRDKTRREYLYLILVKNPVLAEKLSSEFFSLFDDLEHDELHKEIGFTLALVYTFSGIKLLSNESVPFTSKRELVRAIKDNRFFNTFYLWANHLTSNPNALKKSWVIRVIFDFLFLHLSKKGVMKTKDEDYVFDFSLIKESNFLHLLASAVHHSDAMLKIPGLTMWIPSPNEYSQKSHYNNDLFLASKKEERKAWEVANNFVANTYDPRIEKRSDAKVRLLREIDMVLETHFDVVENALEQQGYVRVKGKRNRYHPEDQHFEWLYKWHILNQTPEEISLIEAEHGDGVSKTGVEKQIKKLKELIGIKT